MSLSSYELASQSLTSQIINLDIELTARVFGKNLDTDEIYQIFRQRLSLYDKVSTMPLIDTDRLLLDNKKTEIGMELKLYRFRQHMEEKLKGLISRLDDLESQLVTLKEKR